MTSKLRKLKGGLLEVVGCSQKESENSSPNSPTGVDFGFNIDDYLVSQFKAAISNDLLHLRQPRNDPGDLWVFRSDPTPSTGEKEPVTQNRNLEIIGKITNVFLHGLRCASSSLDVLIQFWAPSVTTTGGRCILATSDQPFAITGYHEGLCAFRKLSMDYRFYVDGMDINMDMDMDTTDEKEYFGGLICSVFMQKSPTMHLNLKRCSNKEYPQLDQLVQCKIKGFATFPVLEPSSMGCVGVIEILSTTENIQSALMFYTSQIRRRLEGVGLLLSDIENHYQELVASEQESVEELSAEVINSPTEKNFDNYQIDLATESPPGTEDLLNSGGMVRQQLAVEGDTTNNANHVISAGKSYITATDLVKEGKIKTTKREHRENETSISYEVLKGYFGMKLEDAAEKLCVSRSTLKRLCRQYGITRWPSHKRNKVNHPLSNKDPSSSNPPTDQAIQDGRIATIKAEYGDDIIKFKLSFSSRMRDLEEEVGKRLKLVNGTFKIKYEDGDNDRILIACDADLNDCIRTLTSLGITTIKMFVEPCTLS